MCFVLNAFVRAVYAIKVCTHMYGWTYKSIKNSELQIDRTN